MSVLMGWLAQTPWLAQSPPPPPQGPEFGGSSPIGLVVILLMAVAMIFLIRSMNKHLRKVPKSFDPPEEAADSTGEPDAEPRRKDSAGASNGTDADSK